MAGENEKVEAMSETDFTGFLERQEIRDVASNEKIAQNSKDIASLTSLFGTFAEDRTKLFDLHNDNVTEKIRSGKEQWKSILQGLSFFSLIVAAIVGPIAYNVTSNKAELTDNHTETRAMFKEAIETFSTIKSDIAVIEVRQYYTEVISALEGDHQNRVDGAWVDEQGNMAHPARHFFYQPLPPRR